MSGSTEEIASVLLFTIRGMHVSSHSLGLAIVVGKKVSESYKFEKNRGDERLFLGWRQRLDPLQIGPCRYFTLEKQ